MITMIELQVTTAHDLFSVTLELLEYTSMRFD